MGINIPQINSVCFVSLKTASIIIGFIEVALYILYGFVMSVEMVLYQRRNENIRYDELATDLLFGQSIVIRAMFSILLLFGTFKEKSAWLMAWIIYDIAGIMDFILNAITNFILYPHWHIIIGTMIDCGINSLSLFIVFNYYRVMPKQK